MNKDHLRDEIESLRRHLDDLADGSDDELRRYEAIRPRMPPGFYWRVRWLAGRMMRSLESLGIKQPDPWPPGLKQIRGSKRARPLLIWAVGVDRDTLRAACRALVELREDLPKFAPVLVTDVADFGFFSRLGWLVEFLPDLSGEGQPYAERKATFVARLYRAAPALPASALEKASRDDLRRWLVNGVDAH